MANALTINSVETLEQALPTIRASQEKYASFTQEQVDTICEKTAMAVSKMRIPLAKMACEETGYGIVVDKVTKNQYASEHVWNYMRNAKTCGIIEENPAFGTKRVASPKGVIAAITPTTNPTSTTIYKIMLALKTRNAIILSPHPHAVKCSIAAAKIMRDAAIQAGMPEHVISWIETPTLEISDVLMKKVDLIMATGGSGMVHAAYSSGTPAIGVGPGNCNVVIDETADLRMAVESIIHSKTFDNGMICATEQHITVLSSVYDEVKALMKDARCYFLNDEEAAKVAEIFFNPKNHGVKPPAVGQTATHLAEMAGITVPYDAKVLVYETNDTSHDNPWANEKLTTLLGMFRADTLEEAFNICAKLVYEGGAGHSAALYVDPTEEDKIDRFAEKMKAGRILINQPTAFGGIGDLYNFDIAPSLTLGPGAVGHSAYMGNTHYEQLLDIKVVTMRKENMLWLQLPKKVYYKTGCTPVALREMKQVYNFKRAFIITDATLFELGMCDSAIKQLETLHDTEIAAQPKKALNILISPALGLYNLPGITKAFLQQYPYIHLKIMQHETEEIQRLLTEGNALGIFATFAAPPRDDALIHYDFLFSDKLYIAISPLHPLAKQKSVSLRTLLKYPLAIYQNSYAYANPLCHLLEQYGQPDYYTMTNNIDIYQNAIINNQAVGFHVKSAFQKNTAFPQISSDILTMPIKNAPPLFVYLGVEKNYFQANRGVINAFLEVYLTFI